MADILTDALAVLGVVLNGLPQGLLALTYGFASIPTALAFFVGAIGNTLTQSVAPISFQAETITYAGTTGKNRSERCTMIFLGGSIMALVTALIAYYLTKDSSNTLVYTIVVSVAASCIANDIFKKNKEKIVVVDDKLIRQKFTVNINVILGALGMVCLNIGSNISFGSITASMATGGNYNVDNLTVISSLADMASSFFGGAPVESIISATASAPHPVWAGVAMMVIIGVILLTGVLPKISKYVPSSSIAGFLFVLGIFKTVVLDAPTALSVNAAVGGTTMVVTAVTNPFLGMLSGILVRLLGL